LSKSAPPREGFVHGAMFYLLSLVVCTLPHLISRFPAKKLRTLFDMLIMMKEFGFDGSYFASYPDKNGILFKRARMGGQHVNL
jgi:hypothetical protein